MNKEISFDDIREFEVEFDKDRANTLAMNAIHFFMTNLRRQIISLKICLM